MWYSDRLKQWWKEIYDDQVGELYFYNEISNETRSDLPPISPEQQEILPELVNNVTMVYKEGTIHWAKCEGKKVTCDWLIQLKNCFL